VLRLLELNAELRSAAAVPGGMEFAYQSSARALAYFESLPGRVQIDGAEAHPVTLGNVMIAPPRPAFRHGLPAIALARSNTCRSISAVNFPVDVFCWLG
jgi:hypothetical protein